MKTVFKFLTVATLAVAFSAALVTTSFAQTDEEKIAADKTRLYDKGFIGDVNACKKDAPNPQDCNYKTTDKVKRKAAFESAREYVKKYEADNDGIVTFLKKRIEAYDKEIAREELFARFNDSVKNSKWADSFTSGKEILRQEPELLDIEIVLASIAYDLAAASPPNNTFNAESIGYAKSVIQKVEAGKKSDNFGAFAYIYKTPKYTDGKANLLGWMNYTIGFLLNAPRTKVEKDTLGYYAKALTYKGSEVAEFSDIQRAFASFYVSEFSKIDTDRVAKIKIANGEDTDETKALLALQKGYADRAIEAYARAQDSAKKQSLSAQNATSKEFFTTRATGFNTTLTQLYRFRFDKDSGATVPAKEIDSYVTGVLAKPMSDVNTAVTPVEEVKPVVVPPIVKPTTKPVTPTTKPTTPAKPTMTTPVKPTTTTPTTPVKKPVAKKPVGKKKV